MSDFWKGKKVLVTGGTGFVGSKLCHILKTEQAEVTTYSHDAFNLTRATDTRYLFMNARPEIVIHLAANVGGIGYNQKYPGELFYDNALMGIHVIEQSRKFNVAKLVVIGTTCAYPKMTPIPFSEDDLWNGYPEETNAAYGIAKRMLLTMCQAYRQQYGLNAIYLLPANLYGPGDNFDLDDSHVIPAMIRKFIEARNRNNKEIVLWGDGSPTREFLYVWDCVDAILLAAERYDKAQPVNIGTGDEINMFVLADLIAKLVGYSGKIVWDATKPNGQPRRALDTNRAREFGFSADTPLDIGLRLTIEWYERIHGRI